MHLRVKKLLEKIRREAPGNVFTGAGVVVYESLDNLPLFLMGEDSVVNDNIDLFTTVLESSLATNPNHDGFCMVSKDFKLTHKNIYFAPPIDQSVSFDNSQGYGTRYVAALMGSKVEGVLLTAVVSNSYGIIVFVDGKVYGSNKK